MKKLTILLMSVALLLGITACGSKSAAPEALSLPPSESIVNSAPPADNSEAPITENAGMSKAPAMEETSKTLVVYFSLPETTDTDNMTQEEDNSTVVMDGEVLGNTQYVAYVIQENTGADIFRIKPKTPYTTNHEDLVDVAKEEQNNNARPELAAGVEDLDQYDTIFIGYPNWWGDMPMAVYTFLDTYDLSGKTVIPFCTSGGSGLSDTVNSIKAAEPNATVLDGLAIRDNSANSSESKISEWIAGLGL